LHLLEENQSPIGFLPLFCGLREEGGSMKIALVMIAGLTIGTLITISFFQLLRVIFQEMVDITSEAWHSAEGH